MTRIIELKEVVSGTYYRPGPQHDPKEPLLEVPEGTEYDPKIMIHQVFSYKSTLIAIMRSPTNRDQPMDYEDMATCVEIITHIKKYADGDKMPIADDLYSKLSNKIRAARWLVATDEAVQFVSDITHAPAIAQDKLDKLAAEQIDNDEELNRAVMATAPATRPTLVHSKSDKSHKSNGRK